MATAIATFPARSDGLPAGPVVPGWTRLITNLSPRRIEFDSLAYLLDSAQKFGSIFGIYLGDTVTIVITDPALAHEILVTRANEFHKAALLRDAVGTLIGNGLLTSEGDFWRRQRALAQPAFHFKRVAGYANAMVGATQRELAQWQPGETRDISHAMMAITLDIVCKTLFDMDVRDQAGRVGALMHTLLNAANDRLNAYSPVWERIFKTQQRAEDAALVELNTLLARIIHEHRQSGADHGDLLSMLLEARDEDGKPMSEKQLRDEVATLFVAGHETTANLLAWSFYLLAKNPAVEAKARAELDLLGGIAPTMEDLKKLPYLERVLKEAMRLYPPAGGATRMPIHDIELAGYRIPAGTSLAISTYVMHRDPRHFRARSHSTRSVLARRTNTAFRRARICRLAAARACALAMPLR